ncbi:MAG: glycosyltransferase [Candidatus Omnitrophota bacterium]
MHISNISGHRGASLAIERALHVLDEDIQTYVLNAFSYTHPFVEHIINTLYMFVIKKMPQFWEYLYDNENVFRRLKKIRDSIHRLSDKKLTKLLENFAPDVIVCTQAFPCGMIADYKRRHGLTTPLVGILTDYTVHGYWLHEQVNTYIVAAIQTKQDFIRRGVEDRRIKVIGIPIDPKFARPNNRQEIFRRLNLNPDSPIILIMGGGQGMGPIRDIICLLDKIAYPAQVVVVCGINNSLLKWLNENKNTFKKSVHILGYTEKIDELMSIAALIITKPGGLTSAEALSKSLPIIIIHPLPGQEIRNTRFLLDSGVALKTDNITLLPSLIEDLLNNREKLDKMKEKAVGLACPDSALQIAQLILEKVKQ